MNRDDAPGLDGFSPSFYVKFRHIIKTDLMQTIRLYTLRGFHLPNAWSATSLKPYCPKFQMLQRLSNFGHKVFVMCVTKLFLVFWLIGWIVTFLISLMVVLFVIGDRMEILRLLMISSTIFIMLSQSKVGHD